MTCVSQNRTPAGVEQQFKTQVRPMHDLHVDTSKAHATRVISGEKSFGPVLEEIVFGLRKAAIQAHHDDDLT